LDIGRQIRTSLRRGGEPAHENNLTNFSSYLERMLDELSIDRMEGKWRKGWV